MRDFIPGNPPPWIADMKAGLDGDMEAARRASIGFSKWKQQREAVDNAHEAEGARIGEYGQYKRRDK